MVQKPVNVSLVCRVSLVSLVVKPYKPDKHVLRMLVNLLACQPDSDTTVMSFPSSVAVALLLRRWISF